MAGQFVQVQQTGTLTSQSGSSSNAANASGGDQTQVQFVSDMMGECPLSSIVTGSGAAYYGPLTTPGGLPTLPTGWTIAQLINHPGMICVQTAALNDVAEGHIGASVNPYQSFFLASTGPTWSFNHIFAVPAQLSSSTDRYIMSVGNVCGTTAAILGGIYIEYTDNVNSGNWVLKESGDTGYGAPFVVANSSIAAVANSWNKLQITVSGKTISANLNGTFLGSGTSTVLNTNNYIIMSLGGMRMSRTVASGTPPTIVGYLDRSAAYTSLTR